MKGIGIFSAMVALALLIAALSITGKAQDAPKREKTPAVCSVFTKLDKLQDELAGEGFIEEANNLESLYGKLSKLCKEAKRERAKAKREAKKAETK